MRYLLARGFAAEISSFVSVVSSSLSWSRSFSVSTIFSPSWLVIVIHKLRIHTKISTFFFYKSFTYESFMNETQPILIFRFQLNGRKIHKNGINNYTSQWFSKVFRIINIFNCFFKRTLSNRNITENDYSRRIKLKFEINWSKEGNVMIAINAQLELENFSMVDSASLTGLSVDPTKVGRSATKWAPVPRTDIDLVSRWINRDSVHSYSNAFPCVHVGPPNFPHRTINPFQLAGCEKIMR